MPSSAAVILYSQLDNPSDTGVSVQTFELAFSAVDSMGADDFVVTGDGWNITEVQLVFSVGALAVPTDVNISFYDDDGGLPGDVVQQFLAPFAGGVASLGAGIKLMAGSYWLGVTFDRISRDDGQIFWSTRTTQSGFAGVWQNPGDGFSTGCVTWDVLANCYGGVNPDYLFQLSGNFLVNGVPVPVPVPGTFALVLVALGGIGLSRRRRG